MQAFMGIRDLQDLEEGSLCIPQDSFSGTMALPWAAVWLDGAKNPSKKSKLFGKMNNCSAEIEDLMQ